MNIKNIKHEYPNFTLSINDLSVGENKIIGLVGENGSGKTTLMDLLSGFLKANRSFEVLDYQMDEILFIPSDLGTYEYLTVGEFCTLVLKSAQHPKELAELLNQLKLADKKDTLISDLSQGMKKKLSLINLFTENYKFLILDEPFNSIDMSYVYDLKKEIKKISERATVLISSHILDTLNDLCDEFIYLKDGAVLKQFENNDKNVLEREIFE
ncbi:hypothetical protein OfM1_05090 [Lactovum odontotermitis]